MLCPSQCGYVCRYNCLCRRRSDKTVKFHHELRPFKTAADQYQLILQHPDQSTVPAANCLGFPLSMAHSILATQRVENRQFYRVGRRCELGITFSGFGDKATDCTYVARQMPAANALLKMMITSPLGGMSLSVCLSACITQKPHG